MAKDDLTPLVTNVPLRIAFAQVAPELVEARKPIDALRATLPEFPTSMVFQERPADHPRTTHRHHRGEYLSPRDAVSPQLPSLFAASGRPANRLEFARWLASRHNPLVARVTVNRAWRALFGEGLVRTNGDFGTQSDPPTHPALLDWLAVEWMESGWSMKDLHRRLVLSATYRQSSRWTEESRQNDPGNRQWGRGGRFRLDGEVVRDALLRASGLLSNKMFGPGVYPPQPASVTELAYGSTAWVSSHGDDRFRRSIYTFAKRTAPFAAFTVFDGPSGEVCLARRDRSNTPLQALTLMNDEMYVEMARALAFHALADVKETAGDAQRAEGVAVNVFRRLVTRPPTPDELRLIVAFHERQRDRLASGELSLDAIVGESGNATRGTTGSEVDRATDGAIIELAAWTLCARSLMNLDEVVTKQ